MAFKNVINWGIAVLGFCIIAFFLFRLEQAFSATTTAKAAQQAIQNFQISIWVGWLLITGPAIYVRWKYANHILFIIDYLIAITAFIILGVYVNRGAELELWALGNSFRGNVTFMLLRNILLICGMTAFIHAAIWWFSKRWHRR
ncbi:hypothetical protein [Salegentibacter salegens]|uniref:Uncharacterized protein n=1 Tax=Salegentibacter salegens TaxID=143223 RepID=A0A1M7KQM9_9FLAO|nr:hypothetical protein [Salegentibacter salegens]PRX48847.1 hypothetical protein LY58_01138 [Salegentibacter salegens]SHM67739.1 hypothetical protein SAMN05878281_1554 [Salegentibacter salegens]